MEVVNELKNKIQVFFSSHAGVGATSIVHALADKISSLTDLKVCALHLNPYNEGLFDKKNGRSLDEIYIYLKNDQLTAEQLQSYFTKVDQFYVLQGNTDLVRIYEYKPEPIEKLIQLTNQIMDVVLLDIGPNLDNPMSIQGMLSGDVHYLVATQEEKAIHGFVKTYDQILSKFDFDVSSFYLITNKVHRSFSITPKFIAQKTRTKELLSIPRIQEEYLQGVDQQSEYLHADKKANKEIINLAKVLLKSIEIELEQQEPVKKKSFFSMLRA